MTDGDHGSKILQAALEYASNGIYIFPARIGIRGDGKKDPHFPPSWKEASTTDLETIKSWYGPGGAWEGQAICIDTGRSGIVGVDQDVSENKRGPAEWELIGQKSELRVRTPSGGIHDYFRADPDNPWITVANRGEVADGVDIRGDGGLLFAPPTADPRGGAWEWESGDPDWAALPDLPRIVGDRLRASQESRRARPDADAEGARAFAPQVSEGSQLFASPSQVHDFGPGGGFKTRRAAGELLMQELAAFRALDRPGSGRSHLLSQRLGVLAGHGVDVFWTYEQAYDEIRQACLDNGFIAENGDRYAMDQLRRGLGYGMQERWTEQFEPAEVFTAAPEATGDEVDALIAEMLSADDMQTRPAPEYLIKGILNKDSEAWTIGEPGCKKSFVVLDQAAHIVRGIPWRGMKVAQGPVVMIVAEGAGGMSTRVKAYQQKYGRIGDGLYMLPRPVQASDAHGWKVLAAACARLGAVMVVVDTQARVTVGLKENDATDMGVYVEAVRILREATQACVHTIHHTGRNGGDARGSSAIDGAQGTELKVVRTGPYEGLLKVEKQKDMEEHPDIPLHFERVVVGVDEDGDEVTSLVLVESNAFRSAAGQEGPEPWEVGHGEAQVKLIKVLRDQGGQVGLTKAEARQSVVERFYGGDPKRLPRSTWATAWTKVLEKCDSEGTAVVTNVGGARFAVDPVALEGMLTPEEMS